MSSSMRGAASAEPFEPAGVTWSAVSGRLATARRLSACPGPVVFAIIVGGIAAVAGWPWLYVGSAALLLLAGWLWGVIGRQVPAIGYAERDDDLLVRHGILWRQIVVVPYGRLQYVDVQAGPVDRLLGIARVQLHTASASTDAVIPGLPPDEAARVRDRLSTRGQARLAGL